ncbi:hypothetical protein ACNS7O_09655 [Haloferacaceae archaeon DSL9]
MALTLEALLSLLAICGLFFGVAGWALVTTLRQEERKTAILEQQAELDTYSPRALAELREWIENNPRDAYADDAIDKYNECVHALRSTDRRFYDWSDAEIADLEPITRG